MRRNCASVGVRVDAVHGGVLRRSLAELLEEGVSNDTCARVDGQLELAHLGVHVLHELNDEVHELLLLHDARRSAHTNSHTQWRKAGQQRMATTIVKMGDHSPACLSAHGHKALE